MGSPIVTCAREGNLSVVAFDDGKANVFNHDSMDALNAALDRAEADTTHAVVLTGRAGVFSGGIDLKSLPTYDRDRLFSFLRKYAEGMIRLQLFPKPIVAASGGHALAGGCVMLLACDLRLGATGKFKVGLNETQIALTLPSFVIHIAASALPGHVHAQVMLHGHVHTPEEALANRLYHETVEPGRLVDRALERAASLSAIHPAAYHRTKRRWLEEGARRTLAMLDNEVQEGFFPIA